MRQWQSTLRVGRLGGAGAGGEWPGHEGNFIGEKQAERFWEMPEEKVHNNLTVRKVLPAFSEWFSKWDLP